MIRMISFCAIKLGIPACAGMTVKDEALFSSIGVFRTVYVIPAQAGPRSSSEANPVHLKRKILLPYNLPNFQSSNFKKQKWPAETDKPFSIYTIHKKCFS